MDWNAGLTRKPATKNVDLYWWMQFWPNLKGTPSVSYEPGLVFLKSMWVGVAPRSSSEQENLCVTSFRCRLGDKSNQNQVSRRPFLDFWISVILKFQ